jgi:glycolate oxidase
MLIKKAIRTINELKEHIKTHSPSFYYSSQTSTVIPYDKLEQVFSADKDFTLCDLSQMPTKMTLKENGNLHMLGGVSWKEAREYLKTQGRTIMTAPTEELALISAGAATSCTGERCFKFGNLRSQIVMLKYINHKGEEKTLLKENEIDKSLKHLKTYQEDYSHYQDYKNAPYPRFEKEIDLMVGTEGQLGVITEIEIETTEDVNVNHLFMLLPKWEDNTKLHLEVAKKVQAFRDEIILCEFIDSNAFSFLKEEDRPNNGKDALFFEIISDSFENIYEKFICDIEGVDENEIFELTATKFHALRASIPRAVFEENSKMGVTKMGTDVQVSIDNFEALFDIYKSFTKIGVRYNLFGHFGDAHLHFNFMPTDSDVKTCQKEFEKLYKKVVELKGSPFAEHGIGIIKQKYITDFWNDNQTNLFKELKSVHDPHNQFFPQGFMTLEGLL